MQRATFCVPMIQNRPEPQSKKERKEKCYIHGANATRWGTGKALIYGKEIKDAQALNRFTLTRLSFVHF